MKRATCPCVVLAACLTWLAALPAPALAQQYDGVAVKSGKAAVTFAGKNYTFTYAEGGLQQVGGFTMATLIFQLDPKPRANTHLNLTLMYKGPGNVDLDSAFSVSGVSMFLDGDVSRYTRGKSKCTINLRTATPTEVEGTVECPLLHSIDGKVMPALTVQKFSAAAK